MIVRGGVVTGVAVVVADLLAELLRNQTKLKMDLQGERPGRLELLRRALLVLRGMPVLNSVATICGKTQRDRKIRINSVSRYIFGIVKSRSRQELLVHFATYLTPLTKDLPTHLGRERYRGQDSAGLDRCNISTVGGNGGR
ncbi:hypothetical protein ALC57_02050 [Trachymyrmex cornetzi]|uniref:Uncharacterized protein n=1 Tax=Trachymyrmex cornetzi TaxID=471704 RepID=A0A151JPM1_9HYME|nr:hypothetical protein ALC57_02050 [Trachymyrmex cornetzi]